MPYLLLKNPARIAVVAVIRNEEEERIERIDHILEELRLNTEDLNELAKQAIERSKRLRTENRILLEAARKHAHRGGKKR